jgi:hypothetical protein
MLLQNAAEWQLIELQAAHGGHTAHPTACWHESTGFASHELGLAVGQGENSQSGPDLPTAEPSGHIFASRVQAIWPGWTAWLNTPEKNSAIATTATITKTGAIKPNDFFAAGFDEPACARFVFF